MTATSMFKFCKSYVKIMREYAWVLFGFLSSDSATGKARNAVVCKPSSHTSFVWWIDVYL